MAMRKLIAGLGIGAMVLSCGCRSTTSNRMVYSQPAVVATSPVAAPGQAPCCNRSPVASIPGQPVPAQVPVGTQIPATVPPGAVGPYAR